MLLSIFVTTFIPGPIWPYFYSSSFLSIIYPLTFILSSIQMLINTKTICFIIIPVSFIGVSICIYEFPISTCTIMHPFTLVHCTIRPSHDTKSFSHASYPLSIIFRTCLISIYASFLFFTTFIKTTILLCL